jgi:hypothetical protein
VIDCVTRPRVRIPPGVIEVEATLVDAGPIAHLIRLGLEVEGRRRLIEFEGAAMELRPG